MSRGVKISIGIVLALAAVAALWYFYFQPKIAKERSNRFNAALGNKDVLHFVQRNLPPEPSDPAFAEWSFLYTSILNDRVPGINADQLDAALMSDFVNSPNGLALANNFWQAPCFLTIGKNNKSEWRTAGGALCGQPIKWDFYIDAGTIVKMMM